MEEKVICINIDTSITYNSKITRGCENFICWMKVKYCFLNRIRKNLPPNANLRFVPYL